MREPSGQLRQNPNEKHLLSTGREVPWELLFHNTPDGLMIVDDHARVIDVNMPASVILGRSRDALVGSPINESGLPPLQTWRTFGSLQPRRQFQIRRSDDTVRHLDIRTYPHVTPGRHLAVFRDITERSVADETLRHLAAIVASTEDAIYSTNFRVVTSWNPGAERMFGFAPAEIIGQSVKHLIPPDRSDETAGLVRRIKEGIAVRQFETIRLRKDGSAFPVSTTISPLTDSSGVVIGASCIVRDATERRAMEAELRRTQRMEAAGRLAGGVAHDFNNLLTIIMGDAYLLSDGSELGDNERALVQEIKAASERGAALTRQLLEFSRRQDMVATVVDLNELVREMERMLYRLIDEDIQLSCHLDSTVGQVKANRGQLEQVVMNLALNARDAMPAGGQLLIATHAVELKTSLRDPLIELPPGRYAVLEVTDTGHGMDSATQAQMFEPFFSTKTQGKGTGLGLAIVYGIVKQSGGSITVRSQPAKGTSFSMYWPVTTDPPASPQPFDSHIRLAAEKRTILVVEDDAGTRGLIQRALESFGYEVLTGTNGEDAWELARRRADPIHLVVTDVVMPLMEGPELARHLSARFPAIKTLYVSGYPQEALTSRGLSSSAAHFLLKPFTPEALINAVDRALRESSQTY